MKLRSLLITVGQIPCNLTIDASFSLRPLVNIAENQENMCVNSCQLNLMTQCVPLKYGLAAANMIL